MMNASFSPFQARHLFTIAITAVIGAVSLAACGDAEGPQAASNDGPPDVIALAPIGGPEYADGPQPDEYELPRLGGDGGQELTLRCPTIIAFKGRAHTYVDQIQLLCTNGREQWVSSPVGGSGGDTFTQTCHGSRIAIGLQGRAHTYIDRIGIICADPHNRNDLEAGVYNGGDGGDFYDVRCDPGWKLVGMRARGYRLVDGIVPFCARI